MFQTLYLSIVVWLREKFVEIMRLAFKLRVKMQPTGLDFWFKPSSLRVSISQSSAPSSLYFLLFQH